MSSKNSTNPSLFFALPRELRDQIYHEVWNDKYAVIVRYGDHTFKIYYDNPTYPHLWLSAKDHGEKKKKRQTAPLAPWIYANKQFLHEATEQFQRQCTWISDYQGVSHPTAQLTAHQVALPDHQSHFLLSPWKAQTLRLVSHRLQELFEIDPYGNGRELISRVDLYDSHIPRLKFLNSIIPAEPQLKRLELNFSFSGNDGGLDFEPSIDVNFKILRTLYVPSLRSVALSVNFNKHRRQSEVLDARLREEFSALGLALIGGVGKEEFTMAPHLEALWVYEFTRV